MAVDHVELSAFDSVHALVKSLDDDDEFRCRSVEVDERAGGYLIRSVEVDERAGRAGPHGGARRRTEGWTMGTEKPAANGKWQCWQDWHGDWYPILPDGTVESPVGDEVETIRFVRLQNMRARAKAEGTTIQELYGYLGLD